MIQETSEASSQTQTSVNSQNTEVPITADQEKAAIKLIDELAQAVGRIFKSDLNPKEMQPVEIVQKLEKDRAVVTLLRANWVTFFVLGTVPSYLQMFFERTGMLGRPQDELGAIWFGLYALCISFGLLNTVKTFRNGDFARRAPIHAAKDALRTGAITEEDVKKALGPISRVLFALAMKKIKNS